MNRRLFLGGLGAAACSATAPGSVSAKHARPASFHAGMNLAHLHRRGVGYGSEASRKQLRRLRELGVTHVALTPFGYQRTVKDPEVQFGSLDRTLTDDDLVEEMEHARLEGLKVCVKPHIWCGEFWRGDASRQDIQPPDWDRWFESYQRFALHYGELAEKGGASLYCLGLEYLKATDEKRWKPVAEAVRQVFSGQLTYAANWWEEAERFACWSAFDLIGVNAYYPLSDHQDPSLDALIEGWRPHAAALQALSEKHGKKVLFCEAGLRARRGAAQQPWVAGNEGQEDPALQARAYEALLKTFSDQDWFTGVYWWKWFTDDVSAESDPFCPMNREAEQVLQRWWT